MITSKQLLFLLTVLISHIGVCYSQAPPPPPDPCKAFITSYSIKQDVCNPLIIHFENLNTDASSVKWNFGDNSTESGNSVDHQYSKYDTYTVTMEVTYPEGCNGTITKKIPVFLGYNDQLVQTANKTICPGQDVQLNTMVSNLDFCWLPANGLTDTKNRNPIVKPIVTTTYRFQTRFIGENLLKNPGFEDGNTGFTSEYLYQPVTAPRFEEAEYFITTNPNDWHPGFDACKDHTTETGNLMIVNGSPDTNVVVWKQTVPVTPNTTYSFSIWISSVNKASPAKLRFQINGVILNDEVNAGDIACLWKQISALWNSGTATTAEIVILNDNPEKSGNDYALDDLSFSTNSVSYDEVTVTVEPEVKIKASPPVAICEGASTTLTATGGASYSWSPAAGLSNASIANPVASPSITTEYTVTGTTPAGCSGKDVVTVTVNPLPKINLGGDAGICINGSYQIPGKVEGASALLWTPSTGLSNTAIANPDAKPATTTDYTLTATSDKQCVASQSITINVAAALNIKVTPDSKICEGTSKQLEATGATKYSWSPATGLSDANIANPVASPKVTTTYTVTGISDMGCEGTAKVTITVDPVPSIKVGEDAAFCIGGSYQIPGVATNSTSISWSPATGLSDATIANPVASPTTTTTYTVTATNGQCTATDDITINVAAALQIQTIEDATICGATTKELTTTVVAGGKYKWTPAEGLSDATISNPVATLKTGTVKYSVEVTSADGCTGTDEVTLTVLDQPTIKLGDDAAYCIGGSFQIPGVATNATSISWSPATGLSDATIANPMASPTTTTTYKVIATNGQCTATDDITINVAAALQIKTIEDATICGATTKELTTTVVSGGKYKWTPAEGLSDATISNPVATLKTGTVKYSVEVTSADGCTGTDEVTLTVLDQPTIKLGDDAAYCIGGSYQIPGLSTNATSFSWSPATGLSDATIANPLASPTTTTTYKVTATNGQCTATDDITINVAAALQIKTIKDTTLCGSGSVELKTTAVSGATYQWSPATGLSDASIASPTATLSQTSTYKVLVNTPDGCSGQAEVTISVNLQPTVSLGNDAAICIGNSYKVPGVATNATLISWSPSTGLSDAGIANPVASPTTTTTYIVTTSNGQCIARDTITINVSTSLQINTIKDTTLCGPGTVTLKTTSVAGGKYQWFPATGLSDATIANPVATLSQTTKYSVAVSTPEGCAGKAEVTITVNPQPTISVGNDAAICGGNNYQIPGVATNATQISWLPKVGLSDATIVNPIATPPSSTTYIVTATNGQCVARDTITVSYTTAIQVTPINDTSICAGNKVQLGSTMIPGAKYQWSPATGLSDATSPTPIASPSVTTNYILTVTSTDGCKGTDSVLVTVSPIPVITMSSNETVCIGSSTTLKAESPGAKQFQWSPATGLSNPRISQPVVTVTGTTSYSVIVTNSGGCTNTGSVTITAAAIPVVGITKSNDIDCNHSEVFLKATGGSTYQWSPSIGLDNPALNNPIAKPTTNTTYTVMATSADGCTNSASVTVDVKAYPVEDFKIPNAFTPNNDGLNDCFGLRSANLTSPFQFEVYNRWGEKVFATSSTTICWDGTYKGKPQPGDAYVWQVRVKGECGDVYKKGTVVLIR